MTIEQQTNTDPVTPELLRQRLDRLATQLRPLITAYTECLLALTAVEPGTRLADHALRRSDEARAHLNALLDATLPPVVPAVPITPARLEAAGWVFNCGQQPVGVFDPVTRDHWTKPGVVDVWLEQEDGTFWLDSQHGQAVQTMEQLERLASAFAAISASHQKPGEAVQS